MQTLDRLRVPGTSTDFARIAELVRREAELTLGVGFDRPGARGGAAARKLTP